MSAPDRPPAGWYPDPQDPGGLRWWDGATWSAHRAARPAAPSSPPRLRNVGQFIAAAFTSVARAARPLLVLAAIAIVPLVVALVLADGQLGFTDWLDEVVERVEQTDAGETLDLPRWDVNGASAAIWGLAITILYLFAFAVVPLAAIPLIDGSRDERRETDLDAALRVGLRAVPRALGVALVTLLGVIALLLVPGALLVLVPPLGALLLLGALPLIVYLGTRLLSIYQPLLVIEGLGLGLFRRSWELTRGQFWGLFGRSLLFGLIVGLASNVMTFPFQLLGAADPQLATVLGFVVGVAAGAASGIVQVAGPVILYRDLVDGPPAPAPPMAWGPPPSA